MCGCSYLPPEGQQSGCTFLQRHRLLVFPTIVLSCTNLRGCCQEKAMVCGTKICSQPWGLFSGEVFRMIRSHGSHVAHPRFLFVKHKLKAGPNMCAAIMTKAWSDVCVVDLVQWQPYIKICLFCLFHTAFSFQTSEWIGHASRCDPCVSRFLSCI